jgi:hypothetical protein
MVCNEIQLSKETMVKPERGATVNPKHIARILKYLKKRNPYNWNVEMGYV